MSGEDKIETTKMLSYGLSITVLTKDGLLDIQAKREVELLRET